MSTREKLFQTGLFKSASKQPLRNVLIFAPTIIWVQQGSKTLWWQEKSLHFGIDHWILVPANSYLTFINHPKQQQFLSQSLTFFIPPPPDWIWQSKQDQTYNKPMIEVNNAIKFCFETIFDLRNHPLSTEAKRQIVLALYAELKENKALHLLFPSDQSTLKERVARYFSTNPSEDHKIDLVAKHFLMSTATFKRKLAAEDTSFRQILVDVRMNFSLDLLQKGHDVQTTALACGYNSATRFSSRFKHIFGLSPKAYLNTL